MRKIPFIISAALIATVGCAPMQETMDKMADKDSKEMAPAATATILTPANGAVVSSPVKVVFGLEGMGVAPAGTDLENTGHHHLIIDAPLPDLTLPIPADANHRHFGGGQTEVSLDLAPGKHTLQLLMGNFIHVPHSTPVTSEMITVTVK